MSRQLYSPRLSDDVVRALYREGRRRRTPMTKLADTLLRQALGCATRPEPCAPDREPRASARFDDAA